MTQKTGASWTEWMCDPVAPTTADLMAETVEYLHQAGYEAHVTETGVLSTEMPDHLYRVLMEQHHYVCTHPVTYSLSYVHHLFFRSGREASAAEDQMRADDIEGPQSEIDIPDGPRHVQISTEFAIAPDAQKTIIDRYHPISTSFNVMLSCVL